MSINTIARTHSYTDTEETTSRILPSAVKSIPGAPIRSARDPVILRARLVKSCWMNYLEPHQLASSVWIQYAPRAPSSSSTSQRSPRSTGGRRARPRRYVARLFQACGPVAKSTETKNVISVLCLGLARDRMCTSSRDVLCRHWVQHHSSFWGVHVHGIE